MLSLSKMYRPITASPFKRTQIHCEVEPCQALKPFIRCFWGTEMPVLETVPDNRDGIIIPDTCMDIIFYVNHTENRSDDVFCAVDERSFQYDPERHSAGTLMSTFGIRFYAWTAALFAEDKLDGSKNGRFPVDQYFASIRKELEPHIFREQSLLGRKAAAEKVLMKHFHPECADSDLLNAIDFMLENDGRAKISDVYAHTAVSEKKLERVFMRNMGISPKAFSSLLRYQLLWQEMISNSGFDVLDAVEKYGYTDQPHLLNDFKRRHTMTPREAVEFASKNK